MEKKKLTLKKETIEVLNQNEMSSLYGGENTGGTLCNTVFGCDATYGNCYLTSYCGGCSYAACGGGHLVPDVPSPSKQTLCKELRKTDQCLTDLNTQVCSPIPVETTACIEFVKKTQVCGAGIDL